MSHILDEMARVIKELGISEGDSVYVSSDITQFVVKAQKKENITTTDDRDRFLHELIDMLQHVVGKEGTLLFPVFTWSFCKGKPFDVKKTPGEVGV